MKTCRSFPDLVETDKYFRPFVFTRFPWPGHCTAPFLSPSCQFKKFQNPGANDKYPNQDTDSLEPVPAHGLFLVLDHRPAGERQFKFQKIFLLASCGQQEDVIQYPRCWPAYSGSAPALVGAVTPAGAFLKMVVSV